MLTRRQQQILDIIYELQARHSYAPTLDEIARASGINTRSTIHQHVQALISLGRLLPAVGKRAYRLPDAGQVGYPPMPLNLPLQGRIAAGKPIEAISGREDINPTEIFRGKDRYVLKVCGDSMIDIGIMDGDFVVIQAGDEIRNGDIVVALVNNEEATLKRIVFLADGRVELKPENKAMQSLFYPVNSVQVQGRMVGLFRSY